MRIENERIVQSRMNIMRDCFFAGVMIGSISCRCVCVSPVLLLIVVCSRGGRRSQALPPEKIGVVDMNVQEMDIGAITPYEKNPRIIPEEAVERVANSIREFGFQQPIVVDKYGVIIVGHTRLLAAKKLGLKKVPVVVASELSPEKVKAYRLADNKTNEATSWNDTLLFEELQELETGLADLDFSMSDFGFDLDFTLADEEGEEQEPYEDDFDVTPPEDTDIRRGDMFQLGEHILLCGDATSPEDVESLMGGGVSRHVRN